MAAAPTFVSPLATIVESPLESGSVNESVNTNARSNANLNYNVKNYRGNNTGYGTLRLNYKNESNPFISNVKIGSRRARIRGNSIKSVLDKGAAELGNLLNAETKARDAALAAKAQRKALEAERKALEAQLASAYKGERNTRSTFTSSQVASGARSIWNPFRSKVVDPNAPKQSMWSRFRGGKKTGGSLSRKNRSRKNRSRKNRSRKNNN